MPITLSTLFTSPQDVWDLLSTEGVDLREDDHNRATGQIITTTADAVVGAISITVSPLPIALLKGAELVFDQAGMSVPVTVQLSAAAAVASTSISVTALDTAIPSGAEARDSGINAATGARLLVGCRKGTSRVKLYCNKRYDDSQLVLSGTVCDWATLAAAKFLCTRRAQGCPKSILYDYEEMMKELAMVQAGQLDIEDIGTRYSEWPQIINVQVRPTYNGMQARVQPGISEESPTVFGQFIDWNSVLSFGW